MRLAHYQWQILDAGFPSQLRRVLKVAMRDNAHKQRSKGYAIRAEGSRRIARDAIVEYRALCDRYSESVDRSLETKGLSGSHFDPDLRWDQLSEGEKRSLLRAMDKRASREHAISLALRLIDAMAEGKDDAIGIV